MPLEDHFSLQIFKISRLLDKITGLQVTSPDMNGRELDIPISLEEASLLNAASDDLRVNTYYPGCHRRLKLVCKCRDILGYSIFFLFQINIYTPAGFIYPHYDSTEIEIENIPEEHRIATSMLYV